MRCPTPVILGWETSKLAGGTGRPLVTGVGVVIGRCKRWRCEACGPGKRAEALKLIRAGAVHGSDARQGQPLRFLTLTYPRGQDRRFDVPEDIRQTSEDFRRWVQAMRRHGRQFEYVRVLERTQRGRIHVHVIAWGDYVPKCTDAGRRRRRMPTGRGSGSPCYCSEARACAQRLAWAHGFGWVEVRAIKNAESAAAYVAKYVAKQSAAEWPRYARRLTYSRRFADGLTLGTIHRAYVAEALKRIIAAGGVVEAVPERAVWRCYSHRGALSGTRAPPRPWAVSDGLSPAGRWSAVTGEALPSPY